MEMVLDRVAGQDMQSIAFRVGLRQEMLGLQNIDMANLLGMTEQTYGRLVKGSRPFDSDTLYRLSQVLRCNMHYLMDIPDEFGNGAAEHLLILYWQSLPAPKDIPWVREGLLETLRKTVVGYVLENKEEARLARLRNESSEAVNTD